MLDLLRHKKRRFVTMMTVDQFCDGVLIEEMAAAGCLGVAVGVESLDDDNCISVHKFQNIGRPFREAVRWANALGIQVCGLIMLGLPHDTPERLARSQSYLEEIPCALYDFRILRIYPSTPLYREMLGCGKATQEWWLREELGAANDILPGCLGMHFRHDHFSPIELQSWALKLTSELGRMKTGVVANVLRVGRRGHGLKFAGTLLSARQRSAKQARMLLHQVELATAANRKTPPVATVDPSPQHEQGGSQGAYDPDGQQKETGLTPSF